MGYRNVKIMSENGWRLYVVEMDGKETIGQMKYSELVINLVLLEF